MFTKAQEFKFLPHGNAPLLVAFLVLFAAQTQIVAQAQDVFYIEDIVVHVEGRTKESAVLRVSGLKAGAEFSGEQALQNYIAGAKQRLLNNRVLESTEIQYSLNQKDGQGRTAVRLLVETRDSRNFIILPEPKYTSNAGFEPAIKIRDYNFFGTMLPLKVDLGYTLDDFHINDASKGMYSLLVEAQYPFRAVGFDWKVTTALGFDFVAGEPLSFNNATGISFDLPVKKALINFSYTHGTVIGEEYYSFEKARQPDIFEDISYMYSLPAAQITMPLGIKTENLGEMQWTGRLASKINYRLSGNALEWRAGPSILFSTGAGFDNVNWRENFRDGKIINAGINSGYNTHFNEWQNSAELNVAVHKPVVSFFAVSTRFRFKHWFNETGSERDIDRLEAGSILRGIVDRSLAAGTLFSLNLDFPFRVIKFMPSEWFKTEKFRYFNFEFQLSPIFDFAFGRAKMFSKEGELYNSLDFDAGSILVCGGIEALVFPLTWRSLIFRVSAAWNLVEAGRIGTLPSGIHREIYIGLGLFY